MRRNTNRIHVSFCIVLASLALIPGVSAQVRMMTADGENDVILLGELGVVVGMLPGAQELSVLTLLPDAEPDRDVREGDLLLMIDGKRLSDVAALRAAYESAEVGETVKMGFRRGNERFLASFERRDAEQGAVRMVMMAGPGDGHGDMEPLHEFGVILGEEDGEVVVLLQMPTDVPPLAQGDVVKSINGKTVATLDDFRGAYGPLDVGTEIVLVVSRGDDDITAARSKSADHGGMRIRRGH